jgi:hypothetical protein
MMRNCATLNCRNSAQPGETLCLSCEIASWQDELKVQLCGHPVSDIVQADEGTAYCSACAQDALDRR